MPKTPVLLIGFSRYKDADLRGKANTIIERMTGNPLYPDSGNKLSHVLSANKAFTNALTRKGQVLNYRIVHDQKRAELIACLQTLGRYISQKYPGNAGHWQTTGFDVQLFDKPTQVPHTPDDIEIKDTKHSGEVLLFYNRTEHAVIFEGRHWPDGEKPPKGITSSSRNQKMLFANLVAEKVYWFQVRATGTKGASKWSNPIKWIVR